MVNAGVIPVHYEAEPPAEGTVLYLAGPTYVEPGADHWHDIALSHLGRLPRFRGAVCLPTPLNGEWLDEEAEAQVDWQHRNLARATRIVFWVPRPGLVTFAEFGEWYRSGKAVLGIPPGTEKTDYLRQCAARVGMPVAETLEGVLDLVVR